MRKFQRYFYNLLQTSKDLNVIKNIVKEVIGDSTENNRTLTVNQVIRYLEANQIRGGTRKAVRLRNVYSVLRDNILEDRQLSTKRTDAIDINELVATYRAIVMDDGKKRIKIGHAVG
jgi:hypothetical protein